MNTTHRLPSQNHLRTPSLPSASSTSSSSTAQNNILTTRISTKRAELANLQDLRALSAQLADQMASLEAKLGTLANGTEAVAAVLANWGAVLRAVQMASMRIPKPKGDDGEEEGDGEEVQQNSEDGVPMPQTLVRIPVQEAAAAARGARREG